ncbi:bZIP transcription factor [Arenibacter algicola]|uniref:Outer membrane protein n=1 Tax=Arenibacter algicola TaxID=616991 RepID=A0A221UQN2_9FLAO|nr:bZIP transcription factor [Arenibacter algicola]ASO03615.1 outer membrane protein [Arenibacter algicola]
MKYIHFFFCLLLGMAVQAQIKIGDNPQNIDPSSVLELESSSRVLVITRVNTAQMDAIVPSAGALVYNTDVECIHYYTGTEWKDICDAVAGSITFTSDDGTVVITSTGGNNYDLKVGEITGMNIVNETVFGADIATATIGERQLAPNSVGSSELQDNTVGKDEIQEAAVGTLEIIDGTIKPEDMEPGAFDQLLTTDAAGNVVWLNKNELGATQADQSTITGAGTLADPIKVGNTVLGDILANATAITTKEDVANKSDDTALGNSTTLYPTQNAVKTYVDQLAGAASTLADGNIFVGSAGNVATGVPMGGDATIDNTGLVTIADLAITSPKIADNAVGQPHLADNSVISNKILNGNVTPIKIQPGAANQIMTTNTLGVVTWQPISAVGGNQDLASVLGFGTNAGNNQINNLANPTDPQDAATRAYVDAQVGGVGGTGDITSTDLTITGGTNAAFNDVNLEITAGAVGTAELADNSVNSTKIIDGAVQTVDIANNSVSPLKIESPGAANQMLTTDGTNAVTWVPIAAGSTELADQVTIVGDGTTGNEFEVADNSIAPIKIQSPGAANQMLTTDAANAVTWVPIAAGSTEEADGTTITGTGTNADPFKIEPGTDGQFLSTTAGAVTWTAIPAASVEEADGSTITGIGTNADPFKIEPGTDGQFLSTAGGAVTWTAIPTGSTEEADQSTITGVGTNADPFKIEPSTVLGQFLRTEPVTGNVIWDDLPTGTAGAVNSDGLTVVGDGVASDLQVPTGGITTMQILDLTIGTADIAENAISSTKIANAAILAEDLNQMGAANDQVLKWNGTVWAPAADAGGAAYTAGDGLSLTGNDFSVDDLLGEVTGPTSATVIANDAVTSAKIADGTIAAVDLNQMGAANDQILKWNGTTWAPAADAAGTPYNAGIGLTLNGTDLDVDDLAGEVTGPTSATVIANDAVTSAKIADGTIAAVDLNQMGAANDQVLKWNGAAWAPAADTEGTPYNAGIGLTLNGTDLDVDDLAGEVTGPTSATIIANDAVTSAKIANGTIAAVDLNQMGAANDQVLKWNGTTWAPAADDAGTPYNAGIGLTLNGTDLDVDDLAGEVTGPTSATIIANDAVTSAKIANGTIAAVDLNQMGAANDQVLKWNGTTWAPAADDAGTPYNAGIGLTLNGTDLDVDDLAGEVTGPTSATIIANDAVTSAKIANGTIAAVDLNQMGAVNDQVLKWNGTAWAPAADVAGTPYNAGIGLTLNGTDLDVDDLAGEVTGPTTATVISNNAVTSAKIAPNTIIADDINTGAVTSAEILNATILAEDLNQMGAANDQVLKWNGTAWAPAADAGGTVYTAGIGLSLNGTDFDVDDLAGEVTGPTSATVIANDAVTSAKIANGTIAAVDLNQMGAANDQVLKWNGTAWAPAADAGGTVYTAGIGLSLNGTDFDVDDLAGEVTGPTSATVIANDAVTSAKIANGTIAAVDLNQMGAANDQVLKWNGTVWAPAADNDSGATINNLATDNQTQDAGEDRTYNLNGQDLVFTGLGSIGIGNGANPPQNKLHVSGAIRSEGILNSPGDEAEPSYRFDGDTNTGMFSDAADELGFSAGGQEILRLQESGGNGLEIIATGSLELQDELRDINNSAGTAGQILSSTGTGVDWIDPPTSSGTGTISSGTLDVTGGANSAFSNVTIEIAVGAITSAQIANGTITNDDISGTPADAIAGSKIDPDFTQDVTTTGDITAVDITATGNLNVGGTVTVQTVPVHPDYVFQKYFTGYSNLDPNYKFSDLLTIENFIKTNHHLPGILSAAEIKTQGFWDLGQASKINLEKIEELFLHTIEQEKKIDQLKTENESLSAELQSLRKDMDEIKALLQNKN